MSSINTIQLENDLNKSKTSGYISTIQKLDSSNSGKQDLKAMLRDITGPISHGLEIVMVTHSALNVDLLPVLSGDNSPIGAMFVAAGKPGSREASSGATVTLSVNGPYEPGTKASELSTDDKVIYDTLSVLTGRRKTILDFIVSGAKLSAYDAKRCGIVDKVAQFRNKYAHNKITPITNPVLPVAPAPVAPAPVAPAPVAPAPVAPAPVAPAPVALEAPVAPVAGTQQSAIIQSWSEDPPPTPKKRGRPKATPAAPAVV